MIRLLRTVAFELRIPCRKLHVILQTIRLQDKIPGRIVVMVRDLVSFRHPSKNILVNQIRPITTEGSSRCFYTITNVIVAFVKRTYRLTHGL